MQNFIKASYNEKAHTVEYLADNGDRLLRTGGTIAWRFNNPGNLRPGPKYKLHIGEGHTLSGTFLIFPTPEAGREEKKALLLRKYKDNSIGTMLYIYAPPSENDTEGYINDACKKTGFSRDQIIGQFSEADLKKLMTAMEEREGYHHKKETRKEHWVRTTTVGFSDGARPLAELPVKIIRNEAEAIVKTDAYGQLARLIHFEPGEAVELWVQDIKKEWKKLETLMLGEASKAYTFVRDLLEVRATTAPHNPSSANKKKSYSFRYVVQPNDTLSKIAAKFKTEAGKIQKDNGIKNPNKIMVGQALMIHKGDTESVTTKGAKTAPPSPLPPRTANALAVKTAMPDRSKAGQGHPIAIIPVDQKRAPWMEYALAEAKRWAGKKEDEITKKNNYHKLVNPKGGLNTLVGNSNPWCASFVNWCLKQGGHQISHSPASSQSFLSDKNFVRLDKPVYGAIVVWSNYVEATGKPDGSGHVGFLYGTNAVLGGNQSDAINFKSNADTTWHNKKKGRMIQKIRGYFVPLAYAEFARSVDEKALTLTDTVPKKLNNEFGLSNAGAATR